MEDVRLRIGNFPPLGEPRLELEVLVAAHERVEQQLVDALGLRIDADARVKVRGAAFDEDDDRVGIGLSAQDARHRSSASVQAIWTVA